MLAKALQLIESFLESTPYEVLEFQQDNFGVKLFNRVEIKTAFKKHAVCLATGKCPDCGQPMDSHNHEDGPQIMGVTNEPLN
jgi:hypothetical protein